MISKTQIWVHQKIWGHQIQTYTTYEGLGKYNTYKYCGCGKVWLTND